MSDFAAIPSLEQLIIDRLTGQITQEDSRKLDSLLVSDADAQDLWQQMQQVDSLKKLISFDKNYNAEKSWQAIQDKLKPMTFPRQVEEVAAVPVVKMSSRKWFRYSAAAIIIGVVTTLGVLFFGKNNNNNALQLRLASGKTIKMAADASIDDVFASAGKVDVNGMNTLSVPVTKKYKLKLGDGTEVWMNAASDLNFPLQFNGDKRVVALKGEAYFKVAQKSSAPFVVEVNGVDITVLGTEFNVKAYPGEPMQVSLISGKVSVDSGTTQLLLNPGEAIDVVKGHALHKFSFDETMVLGWMQGIYYFKNEELGNIIPGIERWFGIQIKLNDPALAKIHITGAIEKEKSLGVFLDVLSKTTGISYDTNGNKVLLRK